VTYAEGYTGKRNYRAGQLTGKVLGRTQHMPLLGRPYTDKSRGGCLLIRRRTVGVVSMVVRRGLYRPGASLAGVQVVAST